MIRKLMLAGVAAGALACAGQASAYEIATATISGVNITTVSPYVVASQRTVDGSNDFVADNFSARTNLTQGNLGNGSYLVDFNLTGPGVFARTVVPGDLQPRFDSGVSGTPNSCGPGNFTSAVQSRTATSVASMSAI